MFVSNMRVNQLSTPLGFHIVPLSFSWTVEGYENGMEMISARICILQNKDIVYDSGKRLHADNLDFAVEFEPKARTRYEWQVEVTTDQGTTVKGSSFFETGKINEPWRAKWITVEEETEQPIILRRKFEIKKRPENLRLYICGLGVYEAYLNGKKIGEEYLAPGYHSYDLHLQVQTYDVSDYVEAGENIIEIWLADGWFKGRLGFEGGYKNLYGDRYYAIAELYGKFEDQTEKLLVKTDSKWEYTSSPVTAASIYDGEICDFAISKETSLGTVKESAPANCGKLQDRYSLPILIKERIAPIDFLVTSKGEKILDFGQNITGWVEFQSNLPKGYSIRLTASEVLQKGCFYRDNYRLAKSEFCYHSDGLERIVRPHFTFYGFRYMKIECMDEEGAEVTDFCKLIKKQDFMGCHLRSDIDQIGFFRTGNRNVNQLFSNALWGQKDNHLDVPTDCPQRDERLGWTGDAQIFSETACMNMYMPAFYRKYLWDMRAEQKVLNGSVPNIVPRIKKGIISEHGSCPWADAAVVISWNLYLQYGSKTLLKECYPGMKAWVEYQKQKEESSGGMHLIKEGFHFADWLALDNEGQGPFGKTDSLYIASAYYYYDTLILSKAAKILGYAEAEKYENLAKEIKQAIQKKYFDDKGICICNTQTGSAVALAFGLNPSYGTDAEATALIKRITSKGTHLDTGFVGTAILNKALSMTGHHKLAVDLLLNEEYPGWLYAIRLGATTIWERWNSVLPDGTINPEGMNSLNHYSYGSIVAWMYQYLGGIRVCEAGFKKVYIKPMVDKRLGNMECKINTASGCYESAWYFRENKKIEFQFKIPFNCEARISIGGNEFIRKAGTYTFWYEDTEE